LRSIEPVITVDTEYAEGVITICKQAFAICDSLETVSIPNSLVNLGSYVFESCDNLQYTEYENATYLGNSVNKYVVLVAAVSQSITQCVIPEGTKIICPNAFKLTAVSSLNIPASVVAIGEDAFYNCNELTVITVDSDNAVFSSESGILYDKAQTEIILVPAKLSGDVVIPDSVTVLAKNAFKNRTEITSVVIGNGIKILSDYAFSGCSGITSFTIGSGVTTIKDSALENLKGLKSIYIPSNVTQIDGWAFYGWTAEQTVNCQIAKDQAGYSYSTSGQGSAVWNYGVVAPAQS